ncbi:MAG: hypothetical protein AB1938_21860 [Myxococcota bacterium]
MTSSFACRSVLAAALFLAAEGCTSTTALRPGAGAVSPPGQPATVYAEAEGVRVWAFGDWDGDPMGLAEVMTPVHVAFENQGTRSVRVSYRDCQLVGSSGFRYSALPPFPVTAPQPPLGTADDDFGRVVLADYHRAVAPRPAPRPPPGPMHVHPPPRPPPPPVRFYIAPPYYPWYPGWVVWPHPWVWDVHYSTLYSTWPQPLPTREMIEHALPEGVLQPGGRISGFLYFQHVGREAAVTLEVKVVDAESGKQLAVLQLPFAVVH